MAKKASVLPEVSQDDNSIRYQQILLLNDLYEKIKQGDPIDKVVKAACDGLKKIHRLQGVVIMLKTGVVVDGFETIENYYNNLQKSVIQNAEKLAGIKSLGFNISLFNGSAYTEFYKRKNVLEIDSADAMIRFFQDMVTPDKTAIRKIAGGVVSLLKLKYSYLIPLIYKQNMIGHIAFFREIPLSDFEKVSCQITANKIAELFDWVKVENRLKETEEKYNQLFGQLPNAFALHKMIFDSKGKAIDYKFLEVNPSFEKMIKLDKSQIIGRSVREVIPDIEESLIETYGKVIKSKKPYRFDQYSKEFDKHYEITAIPYDDCCFATIFTDITDRTKLLQELKEALEINQKIIHSSIVGIIAYAENGKCVLANNAAANILGGDVAQLLAQNFNDLDSWKKTSLKKNADEVLATGKEVRLEFPLLSTFGRKAWLDCNLSRFRSDNKPHLLLIINDISEQKQAEKQLLINQERLELALFAANQGLYDINIKTGEFIVSPEYSKMLGYSPEELIENVNNWLARMHPDDKDHVMNYYKNYLEGIGNTFQIEFRQKTKNGNWIWLLSQGNIVEWDENGNPLRMTGTHTNISKQKQTEEELIKTKEALQAINKELEKLSNIDALTNIPNRRYFSEMFGKEWRRARRNGRWLSVLMVDIDHFKLYNDHYGHVKGDMCLKTVASVMSSSIHRPPDMVARYGGEEFIILLPETDTRGAETVASNIISKLKIQNLEHSESPVKKYVTISIGVASCMPDGCIKPQQIVRAADIALYKAKENGRNQSKLFDGKFEDCDQPS